MFEELQCSFAKFTPTPLSLSLSDVSTAQGYPRDEPRIISYNPWDELREGERKT